MNYRHLRLADRYLIECMLDDGLSYAFIAKVIRVHRSTIQREVRRNGLGGRYNHQRAHEYSRYRKLRGEMLFPKMPDSPERKFRMPRRWRHRNWYKDRRTFRYRFYSFWSHIGIGNRSRRRCLFWRSLKNRSFLQDKKKYFVLRSAPGGNAVKPGRLRRRKNEVHMKPPVIPPGKKLIAKISRTVVGRSRINPMPFAANSKKMESLCPMHKIPQKNCLYEHQGLL